MSRILALEPDAASASALKQLVSQRTEAELVVVNSKEAVIAAIGEQIPDLLLAPTCLAPEIDAQLTSFLKQLPDAPQVLTVPPLVNQGEPPPLRRGLLGLLKRRPAAPWRSCDLEALGAQIGDYLEQARARRIERAFCDELDTAPRQGPQSGDSLEEARVRQIEEAFCDELETVPRTYARIHLERARTQRIERAFCDELEAAPPESVEIAAKVPVCYPQETCASESLNPIEACSMLIRRLADDRRRASRRMRGEVPWLSAVKLSWGLEVSWINISSSGILIETTSKFLPGTAAELHLCAREAELVVPARFVRSEVATVDASCVKYHAAAVFEKHLSLPRFCFAETGEPQAVGELLTRVLENLGGRSEGTVLRATFEQGLRRLVFAREIQIREAPISTQDGTDSIYFTVPSRSRAVLQAVFEPHYQPAPLEFKMLKAAAALAAVVLEFESTS